jgi:putative ABC transport system permease protein
MIRNYLKLRLKLLKRKKLFSAITIFGMAIPLMFMMMMISSLDNSRSIYMRKTIGPIVVVVILFTLVLIIVLLGLFGVLWYDISLRKQEIGIRRATGAASGKIFNLVVKEMLVWASIGILIGIMLFVQSPILNLFSIRFNDILVSVISAALIIYFLVFICSLLQASQAAKIQPAVALHEE